MVIWLYLDTLGVDALVDLFVFAEEAHQWALTYRLLREVKPVSDTDGGPWLLIINIADTKINSRNIKSLHSVTLDWVATVGLIVIKYVHTRYKTQDIL